MAVAAKLDSKIRKSSRYFPLSNYFNHSSVSKLIRFDSYTGYPHSKRILNVLFFTKMNVIKRHFANNEVNLKYITARDRY